ncbi:hypothetical protein TVAG_437080 [Trichomonas vaginalis G3]|uniref:Uncharacterized protein n=1 Tax=Trichomonas vaginalis (strain ATCC PRA-98 / G3) TaxID=412133 RepID=A2DFF5_TRIV3|nr:Ankyrin repeat family [Trichomonas vaginalis G3]EAY20883.1 hypothetical protein TVAG_437080 [Trichomonas vaginalis G3]KAI5521507.1 Ankyrin repeat family [Trichomonas vaginalis G3]|eukprot:XP_001581869.1 hypothetical protein [Trichomonas vaginalis G3]
MQVPLDLQSYPINLQNSIIIEDALFNVSEENYEDCIKKLNNFIERRKYYVMRCLGVAAMVNRFKWELYLRIFNDLSLGRLILSYNGINHYLTAAHALKGSHLITHISQEAYENVFPKNSFPYAVAHNDLASAKSMLSQGTVNLKQTVSLFDLEFDSDNYEQISYLDVAGYCGHYEMFEFLLSQGISITGKTCRNVVRGGNIKIIALLIKNKYDLSTNFSEAVKYHKFEAAEYLLSNVDADMPDSLVSFAFCNTRFAYYLHQKKITTPEEFCISAAGSENLDALVYILNEVSKDCEYKGRTPLVEALRKRSFACIKHLAKVGANFNIFDDVGHTAWHYLATSPSTDVLRTVARTNKIDPDLRTKNGETALHLAASQGCITAIDILVEMGADVNAVDANGRTPLIRACIFGRPEPVKALIDRDADKSIKDNEGKTASDYATERDVRSALAGLWTPKKAEKSRRFTK